MAHPRIKTQTAAKKSELLRHTQMDSVKRLNVAQETGGVQMRRTVG